MKEFSVEQGSPDWLGLRLGIATASNFGKILTPKTRKFSTQARRYAIYLVAEKLLNMSLGTSDYNEHVTTGRMREPEAAAMFAAITDLPLGPVGFLTTDDMSAGATPDRRIVGQSAYLEIKSPAPWTHLGYLVDGFGDEYVAQVQGQIYIGEADYNYRFSYHPAMPPVIDRVNRDDGFIADLRAALDQFNDIKAEIEDKARQTGFFEERLVMGRLSLDELTADMP